METQNLFLRELSDAQLDLLRLEPVTLPRRSYIYRVDDQVTHLYFMDRGLVTLIRPLADGQRVAAWNFEGTVIGAQIRFWIPETIYDIYVRIGGPGWRTSRSRFLTAMLRDADFNHRVLNWIHYFDGAVAETVACTAVHSVEQRLCRALMAAQIVMKGDTRIPLSLAEFAPMIVTAKSHVYRIGHELEALGAIRIRGSSVILTDTAILAARSCVCLDEISRRKEHAIRNG